MKRALPNFKTAGAAAIVLLLAACGGAAPAASTPASSAPASASASTSPSGSASGSPSAKPASSAAASGGGTIKIGLIEGLTGVNANQSKDNIDAFNLYLASVNNTVAGRKIETVPADDQDKADVGLTKAKQLVESDKVQILAGIQISPVCNAIASYVKQVQEPLVVTGNCGSLGLMTDPKLKSPYLVRVTQIGTVVVDPAADWAYSQGYRKAIIITSDFNAGLENADIFASDFIKRGGSIVQELYPAVGTTDFGPYVAQLKTDADVIFAFLPGTDGLRFLEQYGNYTAQRKPIIDAFGQITAGPNLRQLKEKAVGVYGDYIYSDAMDSAMNKAFLKAWAQKYPDRPMSGNAAQGYAGAQVIVSALQKIDGKIEQKQQFLDALYGVNIETVKGPIKLDRDHDVIENVYIYEVTQQGSTFGQKLLKTYEGVSRTWDRSEQEMTTFPFGKMKGKWVGMTKDQLAKVTNK